MVVLAIDPSVENCGWAAIESRRVGAREEFRVLGSGRWHPSHKRGAEHRLVQLGTAVQVLIDQYVPDAVVVETPDKGQRMGRGMKRSFDALMVYAQAVGAVIGAASGSIYRRVIPVSVRTWKGTSRKQLTAAVVRGVLGICGDSHDESDALGLGLWWLQQGEETR